MDQGTTRRKFMQVGTTLAAAGVLARLARGDATALAEIAPASAQLQGFRGRQPNFLIILVDEMRYPPIYEGKQLKQFRRRFLRTQERLRRHGMAFHRHYAASTACAPSRTTIFTGQYPSLHGVTQTTGAAKEAIEPDEFWLDPGTVPTLGDYFRAGGYRTLYRGKWHVSFADMVIPGTHTGWDTFDESGTPIPATELLYQEAGRLEGYGFEGWIGPEPHGRRALNSGSSAPPGSTGRDVHFARQAVDVLEFLDRDPSDQPWLLVSSFVNPHDIALYGLLGEQSCGGLFDFSVQNVVPQFDGLFDLALFDQTVQDDLSTKPSAQQCYKDSYWEWMTPIPPDDYFRFYYQLHKNVDEEMGKVVDALQASRFYEDTIVLFTSDHGDLLGSHNYMHQKWYTAYDETLRVPLIISNPRLFPEPTNVDSITSHIDLIPTLLGLAGIKQRHVRRIVAKNHSDTRRLVGRNLRKLVLGYVDEVNDPIYFMSDDDPSRGLNMDSWIGIEHNGVCQPNHLETVITKIDGAVWKYTRYFDNPQFWSHPAGTDPCAPSAPLDIVVEEQGLQPTEPGAYEVLCKRTVKDTPLPDEFEMYNVSDDPMELDNLYGRREFWPIQKRLDRLLQVQCARKRLIPKSGVVPSQPVC